MDIQRRDTETVYGVIPFWDLIARFRLAILLACISVTSLVLGVIYLVYTPQNENPVVYEVMDENIATVAGTATRTLVVDVAGAVVHPGVFRLPVGSRVGDAIAIAGGYAAADEKLVGKTINQAKMIVDGMKIYIPYQKDSESTTNTSHISENTITGTSITSHNNIVSESQGYVSLNSATQSELESLPGIGQVTARKIIDARPYSDIQELVQRKIIGAKTFEKIETMLSL